MAEEPFFSSQGSHYDRHAILQQEQENISSSPPRSLLASPTRTSPRLHKALKPKGLPTVTPKRFTKFFTPRSTISGRGGRQSKAARTLKDITKNGANRRRHTEPVKDSLLSSVDAVERPNKRRKTSIVIASSPPQSSPLKHVQNAAGRDGASPDGEEMDDDIANLLDNDQPFPQPIRRLRPAGKIRRVLERSFGGYDAVGTGWRGASHGASWQAETANFVSKPDDIHSFRGSSLPFCSASCNTNTLVAAGDEKGSIRLMDSAVNEDFRTPHVNFKVHSNAIMDMAFSADDYLLASASGDQTARVVDMHTQRVLAILSGHGSSVKQIRFQPNTDNIITTSARDGTVKVWDLRSGELGSVASLRVSQRRFLNEDGLLKPSVRYCNEGILVGPAHRSVNGFTTSPSILKSEDSSVSITSIQHLPNGREHLLLTASELSASVKLWDLRNARSRNPVALAATPLPETHRKTRNFGLSSMMLSGDGARLYTLCKDATVYAYSTNQILLGAAPEMSNSGRRRAPKETKVGLGPLYAFRHPALRTETFYVKSSLRSARGDGSEILAAGSSSGCAVLFPLDERHFKRPQRDEEHSDDEDDIPSLTRKLARASTSSLPVYQQGTALIRGHTKEVTSMTWTHDGDLVTVADDFTTRVWREDTEQARHLRSCGEGGGRRWGMGWADVDAAWDQEE